MQNAYLATVMPVESSGVDTAAFNSVGPNPLRVLQDAFNGRIDLLNHPDELIAALHDIHLVWAGIFVLLGAICVFNGVRWHKTVIIVLSVLLGVWAGDWLGGRIGGANTIGSVAGAALFGVLAFPGLRLAVALFGGLAGAFLGANIWTAIGSPNDQLHIGSLIGLVAVGMLAFLVFRPVIILFTAVGGATLLVFGALAAMLQVDAWSGAVSSTFSSKPLVLPLVVGVMAVIGIVVQQGGGVTGLFKSADKASAQGKPKAA
ncbi:MAG: hypothetical protein VYC34_08605 [Planctomycetota bacterium]|nr:hypothetical protein [Planctomycetota bacterium]